MTSEVSEHIVLHTLHPFRATQKGQISVAAGLEVKLLNDAHWYWWFIRVLSTNTEGFVPAELLELPREREARLNSLMNTQTRDYPNMLRKQDSEKPAKHVRFNYELQYSPDLSSATLDSVSAMQVPTSLVV